MIEEKCLRFNTEDEQEAIASFIAGMAACGYDVSYDADTNQWSAPTGILIDWIPKRPRVTVDGEIATTTYDAGHVVNVRPVELDMQHFANCDDVSDVTNRYRVWL